MNTLQTELGLVKAKFPSRRIAIEKLYRNDSDFKSLCSDLFLCFRMVHELELEIAEKQQALAEYGGILQDLEHELSMIIEHSDTPK